MPSPPATLTVSPRSPRRAIRAALAHKEWLEQRWRFALGSLVLSALLAGMLRAQIIPSNEAAVLIYWPVGVLLAIFMAMGSVATERADRTWEFLIAQPVSRADVLLAKWRAGLWQLLAIIAIATIAGALALWSRGSRVLPMQLDGYSPPTNTVNQVLGWSPAEHGIWWRVFNALAAVQVTAPILWLGIVGFVSAVSLACWYTPLFFILSRARNEFAAGLGGILLAIVAHVWLLQFAATAFGSQWLFWPSLANPLAPLALIWSPQSAVFLPALMAIHVLVWLVLPCVIVRRVARKAVSQ